MAAFDFPNSPSNGDNYTANGITWTWDGNSWRRSSAVGAQGNVGAQGAQGHQGNTGATGAQGAAGSQGAAGAHEVIYSLLMLDNDFICPSINIQALDTELSSSEIATTLLENAGLQAVMTNSFGFGGTNGSMILSRFL